METVTGQLNALGPAKTQMGMSQVWSFSFIDIGSRKLTKVKVWEKMKPFLEEAAKDPAPVTLYLEQGYLCGITLQNGRAFAPAVSTYGFLYVAMGFLTIFGFYLFKIFVVAGLFAALLVGLISWVPAWLAWRLYRVKQSGESIPNVTVV